mgnify:CR=1 FL=1
MKGENLQDLNRRVIWRQANGKTIFQPRIGAWYDDRMYRGEELPGKFKGCSHRQIYEKIGCSDRLYDFNACFETVYDDSVRVESIDHGNRTLTQTIHTPVGSVTQFVVGNTSNPGCMQKKWYVETEEDLKVFMYVEEATSYRFHQEVYDRLLAENGHLGLPSAFVPRVNMQKLLIELSGVENTYYLLADAPELVEDYFKALSRAQERFLKVMAASPLEWLNYGDNLHCKILPEAYFLKYVVPEYEKRRDIIERNSGGKKKFLFSHFDGDVKQYLPHMKHCFLDGIEAITPLPQGDVTVEEIKEGLGDEVFLIDGIAALLFNHTYPLEALRDQANRLLELFEGQLVLGISDEFPSDGDLARIEYVTEMVNEFNARH